MAEKIKVQIAGRMYPLTVSPEEEIFIRNAGKQIEEMVKNYEKNFAVTDKQDVLAMCTLQLASQLEQQKQRNKSLENSSQERIQSFQELLSEVLQK